MKHILTLALACILTACGGGGTDAQGNADTPLASDGKKAISAATTTDRCVDCGWSEPPEPPPTAPAPEPLYGQFIGTRMIPQLYPVWTPISTGYGNPGSTVWYGGSVVYVDTNNGLGSNLYPGTDPHQILADPYEVQRPPASPYLDAYRLQDGSILWKDKLTGAVVSQQWAEYLNAANGYPYERYTVWTPATGFSTAIVEGNMVYWFNSDSGKVESFEVSYTTLLALTNKFVEPDEAGFQPRSEWQFFFGQPPPAIDASYTSPAGRYRPVEVDRAKALICTNCWNYR